MVSEMEPCAHCGSRDIRYLESGRHSRYVCGECGASTVWGTEAEALAAWNRRSEPRGDSPLASLGLPQPNSGATADTSSAAEVVAALRLCVNGLGSFKNELGDYGLCDTAASLIERLASAPKAEVEGWLDVGSAPRDGSPVLLWYPGLPTNELQIGQWRSYASEWGDLGDWIDPETGDVIETVGGPVDPTHWRPLPAPPATRDGADEPHLVEASTEREARSHTDPTTDPLVIVKPRRKG